MGLSGREERQEMEFLSYPVSDQLDFSTEELGDTHEPVPSAWTPAEVDPVLPKLLLHPALIHILSIPQKRPIIRMNENSAAFLVAQGKDEAFSQVVV